MPGPSTASVTESAPLTDHSTMRSTPGIGLTLVPCGHWGFCLMRKYAMTGPFGGADGDASEPEPVPVLVVVADPAPPSAGGAVGDAVGAPPIDALSPLSPAPPLPLACEQPAPARAMVPAATSSTARVVRRRENMVAPRGTGVCPRMYAPAGTRDSRFRAERSSGRDRVRGDR